MKLQELKWFNNINGDTPVNEIGWAWTILALLFVLLGFIIGSWVSLALYKKEKR